MSDSKSGGPPSDLPPVEEINNPDPTDTFMTSTLTTAVQQARAIPSLSSTPRLVTGSLPRFGFESEFNLVPSLMSLGMTDAFDGSQADFSGMSTAGDLYISGVFHQAFVAVDEIGTEAAAATAVVVSDTSAPEPVTVVVDRPFLFVVRDRPTGAVLFLGRVVDPSLE